MSSALPSLDFLHSGLPSSRQSKPGRDFRPIDLQSDTRAAVQVVNVFLMSSLMILRRLFKSGASGWPRERAGRGVLYFTGTREGLSDRGDEKVVDSPKDAKEGRVGTQVWVRSGLALHAAEQVRMKGEWEGEREGECGGESGEWRREEGCVIIKAAWSG